MTWYIHKNFEATVDFYIPGSSLSFPLAPCLFAYGYLPPGAGQRQAIIHHPMPWRAAPSALSPAHFWGRSCFVCCHLPSTSVGAHDLTGGWRHRNGDISLPEWMEPAFEAVLKWQPSASSQWQVLIYPASMTRGGRGPQGGRVALTSSVGQRWWNRACLQGKGGGEATLSEVRAWSDVWMPPFSSSICTLDLFFYPSFSFLYPVSPHLTFCHSFSTSPPLQKPSGSEEQQSCFSVFRGNKERGRDNILAYLT